MGQTRSSGSRHLHGAPDCPDWNAVARQGELETLQKFSGQINVPGLETLLVLWAPHHFTCLQVKGGGRASQSSSSLTASWGGLPQQAGSPGCHRQALARARAAPPRVLLLAKLVPARQLELWPE